MAFNFGNWLEETWADVNPFDGGKTGASVRATRKAPPATLPAPKQRQASPLQMGSSNAPSRLNVGTSQPQQRLQVKTPTVSANKLLRVSGAKPTVQKPNWFQENIVDPTVRDANKAINTIAVPFTGLAGANAVIGDQLFNGGRNTQNLLKATQAQVDQNVKNSFVPTRVAKGKASPLEFGTEFTKTGVELAPYAVAGGSGRLAAPLSKTVGGAVAARAGSKLAGNIAGKSAAATADAAIAAPTFAGLDAARQGITAVQNGGQTGFDPLEAVRAGAAAGLMAGGGRIAGDTVMGTARLGARGVQTTARAVQEATPTNLAAKDPRVLGFDEDIMKLQQAFDTTPDPRARQQINRAITNARLQRQATYNGILREMSQGGYAKVPGAKPEPTDPLQALKQEALKYKSADEFVYNHGLDHPEYVKRIAENKKYIDEVAKPARAEANRLEKEMLAMQKKYVGKKNLNLTDAEKKKIDAQYKNLYDQYSAATTKADHLPYDYPDKGINRTKDLTDLYNQAHAENKTPSELGRGLHTNSEAEARANLQQLIDAGVGDSVLADAARSELQRYTEGTPPIAHAQSAPVKTTDPTPIKAVVKAKEKALSSKPAEYFFGDKNAVITAKSKQEAKNIVKKELPEFDTKKTTTLDKVFRSTRSIIERQGKNGKQLAGLLQKSRDDEELFQAALIKQMPTVMKLKGNDFENFVEATQGQAEARSPKVSKAVQEWQAVHPQIRDRAVAAGLDVGDLGQTYYPHFIDYDRIFKNKNTYNEAINHLVKTGQATSPEEAIKLLGYARDVSRNRTFGNLEASRIVDLPFYDKTNNSFRQYIQGSTRRIAQVENFGLKDEKALKMIADAGLEGADTEAMKNAYDVAVGAKRYNPTTEKTSRNIRRYITTTRLGLGALTNVSQSVNTGVVTGHFRTMGAMLKQLDPKTREFVGDTGVIADAVINDIRSQQGFESFGKTALGKATNAITAPFFGQVERFNRAVASTAGRDYALRLAQRGDEATLRKLGVTGEISNGTLTKNQQVQAARKVVEKTQFKVDPQDLPGWADSPGGKLVAQFRTFSYNQGKFFSNEIVKPAAKGDFMPLARVLAALPVGYALYEARRTIDGRPVEDDKVKVGLESFSKIGGAGLAMDIYRGLNPVGGKYIPPDRRTSMAVGTLGGPAAGLAANVVGATSEAIQKKSIPKTNPELEGKVGIKSGKGEDKGYNDLTSISRLAIQQAPVVGTAIANRVLPYKKQSEADNGKTTASSKAEAKAKRIDGYIADNVSKETNATLTKYYGMKENEREQWFRKENDAQYKYWLAKYENDKANGKISKIEDVKWQYNLKKDKVGAKYSKDTRDLYGMAKYKIYDFISKDKNGKKYAEELLAYDKALYDAGLTKYMKFRNGLASSGSSGGRRSSGRRSSGSKAKKFSYSLTEFAPKKSESRNKALYDMLKEARKKYA